MSYNRDHWPTHGPHLHLLKYLDSLYQSVGEPPLRDLASTQVLPLGTLYNILTGRTLPKRQRLAALVTRLGGDREWAENLRLQAAAGPSIQPRTAVVGDGADLVVYGPGQSRPHRNSPFLGRDEKVAEVLRLVDAGTHVLLYGMGGIGKTSLATAAIEDWAANHSRPHFWLNARSSDTDSLLGLLASTLGNAKDRRQIADAYGDARAVLVRGVLQRSGIALGVVDGLDDPSTLFPLINSLPGSVVLLITARGQYALEGAIEIAGLPEPAALRLLARHAGNPQLESSREAKELCRLLGYHPFAIEIAGTHVRQHGSTIKEYLRDFGERLHKPPLAGGLVVRDRESVGALLDSSWQALRNTDAKAALLSYAAFSSHSLTVPLLAIFLEVPEPVASAALRALIDVALVQREPATGAYVVHDLTLSFARDIRESDVGAKIRTGDVVQTAVRFVHAFGHDHATVRQNIDNLLRAAALAEDAAPESMLTILEVLAERNYFNNFGHTVASLGRLRSAVAVLQGLASSDREDRLHVLHGKLGNGYYDFGQFEAAAAQYRQAVEATNNPHRMARMHSGLGKALSELGQFLESEREFAQANLLAAADGPDRDATVMFVFEQHGVALFNRHDFMEMKRVTARGLEASRCIGDREYEVIFLNNLGTAEYRLGMAAAMHLHRQAHDIAAAIPYEYGLAVTNRALASDFIALEDYASAEAHYAEALRLFRQGGRTGRTEQLRNLLHKLKSLTDALLDGSNYDD